MTDKTKTESTLRAEDLFANDDLPEVLDPKDLLEVSGGVQGLTLEEIVLASGLHQQGGLPSPTF
jgi:hypothetical protein